MSLPETTFQSKTSILKAWQEYPLDKLNQRVCRTILSVNKKASRLAVLSELGRYPVFLSALVATISYEWHLRHRSPQDSLVRLALGEMESLAESGHDCWLARVRSVCDLLQVTHLHGQMSPDSVRGFLKKLLRSKFEIFWKDEVNDPKLGADQKSHNKLRFYSQFKSYFHSENYVLIVKNRNQRKWLTRLRISAHHLATEKLRYCQPPIPAELRVCKYCCGESLNSPKSQDNEKHFLMECKIFEVKRACFLKRLECFVPNIFNLSTDDKIKTMLCPTSSQSAKLINKFIGIMFNARDTIDKCETLQTYPTWDPSMPNPFIESNLDVSNNSDCPESDLSSLSRSSMSSESSG